MSKLGKYLVSGLMTFSPLLYGLTNIPKPNQKLTEVSSLERKVETDFGSSILPNQLKLNNPSLKLEEHSKERIAPYAPRNKIDVENVQIPEYNIKPSMCAAYARMAAEDLFGMEYTRGNAWDMGDNNKVVDSFNDFGDLESRNLEPGTMVSFYNPKSKYNSPERDATHVVIYIGENNEGKPTFLHQWGSGFLIEGLDELKKRGINPVEAILPRKSLS